MMTLLAFIVTIGILVTIHEYGHYQVARWCGVRVLKFSIGFGKPLWKKTFGKDQTEFILAAIPLGGYVKMLDERELKQEQEDPAYTGSVVHFSEEELARAFNRKSVYQRIAVVLAGPMANLLLAVLLYWILFSLGITGLKPIVGEVVENSLADKASLRKGDLIQSIDGKTIQTWQDARWILLNASLEKPSVELETTDSQQVSYRSRLSFSGVNNDAEQDILEKLGLGMLKPNIPAVIGELLPESPASAAGFQKGDLILSIDNIDIRNWDGVVKYVKESPNKQLQVETLRDGKRIVIAVTPEVAVENGKQIGRLGAGVKMDPQEMEKLLIEVHYSPVESLQKAIGKTWDTAIFSLKMLGNMITGKVSWKGISGPVSIASFAGESANLGIKVFIGFLALVSISIGVLNLLPIPVLDGGHLMYYIAEIFKGSPVSEQVMITGQKIGLGVLGLLMMVAIFNDINRFMIG
ncbi:MAG: RIP metalloprotease RseP [Methylophilus sp.]|nr:RIP metalloprotease RseP [Methylophilus sp.]MDP3609192.1 RIP metalloprotease RseP [Methylophilus sp.]